MGNLTSILGSAGFAPQLAPEIRLGSPEEQLIRAIADAGMQAPDYVVLDGRIHRFNTGERGSDKKTGWYIAFGDGVPAGAFGDWRTGLEVTWCANIGRKITALEAMQNAKRFTEAKAQRDAEQKKMHVMAADTAQMIWDSAIQANPDHPYLQRKRIGANGARQTGDGRLIIPRYNSAGALVSLQYIDENGGKQFQAFGEAVGTFYTLGDSSKSGLIYIAEGFATAATIHEATGRACVIAFNAGNLSPVAAALRGLHGAHRELIIVADNDENGAGEKAANAAAEAHGARVIIPPQPGDANDYALAGGDLAALLSPPEPDWLIAADDFCAQPAPIAWLVRRWVQAQALCMVHGPSGGGKTFVVLDWCLRIASGMDEWAGTKVRPGNVVYLAGEGHHGLRGRIAAWKHYHRAGALNMWLSRGGCDLNTAGGYLQVVEQVRAIKTPPAVIVVDTLHRFLLGDENSAQDAKTMLDACNSLMNEFNCAVILVHHTGVSDDAQHRARGSSAWRGALDIEISIVPARDGEPMQIVQRKSKDAELAEPVFVNLSSVSIPGWVDDDGQQVTSAVVELAQKPVKIDKKQSANARIFQAAWWATDAEIRLA